jgi:hypothetical protein
MTEAVVTPITHRIFGPMLRLTIARSLSLDLTEDEAWALARNMIALNHDYRRADEIYLSPRANDGDFSAKVTKDGLQITTNDGVCHLTWDEVGDIAERLGNETLPAPSA